MSLAHLVLRLARHTLLTHVQVFAGKDASRALAMTSTKPEDALPEWSDLGDKEKETLAGWVSFFAQRYNQVGLVEGAQNFDEAE